MTYLLGLDAGTSVVKAGIFDDRLNEVAVASHSTIVKAPQHGWTEVSMIETWEMAVKSIKEVLSLSEVNPQDVGAIGITGNMIGAWLIDAHGQPIRDAILHIDNRTQPLIEQFSQANPDFASTIFSHSGSVMQPGCTMPLIRWLAEYEPETLDRAAYVLCCKDWLVYQLTEAIQIDPSEASVIPGAQLC